jgi:hypothetical protein
MEVRKRVSVNADFGSSEVGLPSVHCACHAPCVTLIAVLLIELRTERKIPQLIRINIFTGTNPNVPPAHSDPYRIICIEKEPFPPKDNLVRWGYVGHGFVVAKIRRLMHVI